MENQENATITVLENGPYLVKGTITLIDQNGNAETKDGNTALCRCGLSKNKPFCDGAHRNSDVLKA